MRPFCVIGGSSQRGGYKTEGYGGIAFRLENTNIRSRMKLGGTYRFWRSGAQCLLGSIAVALLTFVCFQLQVRAGIAALLYLIVVVLLSATDAFVPSVLVSIIAVLCLNYFFIPPIFSLRVGNPLDICRCCRWRASRWYPRRRRS